MAEGLRVPAYSASQFKLFLFRGLKQGIWLAWPGRAVACPLSLPFSLIESLLSPSRGGSGQGLPDQFTPPRMWQNPRQLCLPMSWTRAVTATSGGGLGPIHCQVFSAQG